jgi:hypothetical protein
VGQGPFWLQYWGREGIEGEAEDGEVGLDHGQLEEGVRAQSLGGKLRSKVRIWGVPLFV